MTGNHVPSLTVSLNIFFPLSSLTWTVSPLSVCLSSLQSAELIILRAVASTSSPVLIYSLSCPVRGFSFLLMNLGLFSTCLIAFLVFSADFSVVLVVVLGLVGHGGGFEASVEALA